MILPTRAHFRRKIRKFLLNKIFFPLFKNGFALLKIYLIKIFEIPKSLKNLLRILGVNNFLAKGFFKIPIFQKFLVNRILGQIFKLFEKIFFGLETKWWVKTSQESFVAPLKFVSRAEKWPLKKILEALFSNWQGFSKSKNHSFGQTVRNFEILRPLVTVKLLILPTGAHFRRKIRNFLLNKNFKCNLW